jgi:hypothetical protein
MKKTRPGALFLPRQLRRPRSPAIVDDRPRAQIPTGLPRLVESSRSRRSHASEDAWAELLAVVRKSALARLDLLSGRSPLDLVACPWQRLTDCSVDCRCGGTGEVKVGFLENHYAKLTERLAAFVASRPKRRSS